MSHKCRTSNSDNVFTKNLKRAKINHQKFVLFLSLSGHALKDKTDEEIKVFHHSYILILSRKYCFVKKQLRTILIFMKTKHVYENK